MQTTNDMRISDLIDKIRKAYSKTGFKPVRKLTWDGMEKTACPLAILVYANNTNEPQIYFSHLIEKFGRDYANGFVDGFDEYDNSACFLHNQREKYQRGKEDGVAVAKEVFSKE